MKLWLILLSIFLVGCTVGPKYSPPVTQMQETWASPLSNGMSCESLDCFVWWKSFNDPLLNSLLERAACQNLDLFIAGQRILEARLLRKGKEAEVYPHIDASVTAGDLYCSKDILDSGIFGKNHSHKRNLGFFEVGFDADWEIDLFGFHAHQTQAAEAKIEAAEASFSDVWVTVSAEIARNYIELRALQKRRFLLEKNSENLKENHLLTQDLFAIGMANEIDLLKIEEQLNQLLSERPQIELSIDKTIHRLSILLGHPPEELICELSPLQELPSLPCEKPLGLPSELLRRRPDIRKAERNLAAATEEVGTAVAALFPRLSLYGFVGEIGTKLSSMTNGNGLTWFAAPQVLFPIFNSRLLKQDVEFNQIQARKTLFEYQKTVLNALKEAENGIASFRYDQEKQEYIHQMQKLNHEAFRLSFDLYQKGFTSYFEVTASQNAILKTEEAALQSKVALLLDYIALYKALGGGWDR